MTEESNTTRTIKETIEDALGIAREFGDGVSTNCAACGDEATRAVYGLPYCERHGKECEPGAVKSLWEDAQSAGERLEAFLEDLIPLWSNQLADKLYSDAVRETQRRAAVDSDAAYEAEASVGISTRGLGKPPGIARGEVDRDEYLALDAAHYRIHNLMQKGFDNYASDEALYGLERERADVIRKLQAAHDWTPED